MGVVMVAGSLALFVAPLATGTAGGERMPRTLARHVQRFLDDRESAGRRDD